MPDAEPAASALDEIRAAAMTDDQVAAYLEHVRALIRTSQSKPGDIETEHVIVAELFPGFVAAVEAALKLHARQDKPVRSWDQVCAAHLTATGTLKLRDRAAAFGEIRNCPDCRYTEFYVCSHCACPNERWPCATYRDIAAALAGKGAGDGET